MPGTRGRKDPSLLAPARQKTAPAVVLVVTGRPLKVGTYEVPAGVEVPGAASWPRVEAWIGARRLRALATGEKYTTFEDFTAGDAAERKAVADALAAVEGSLADAAAEQALKADDEVVSTQE